MDDVVVDAKRRAVNCLTAGVRRRAERIVFFFLCVCVLLGGRGGEGFWRGLGGGVGGVDI